MVKVLGYIGLMCFMGHFLGYTTVFVLVVASFVAGILDNM
ncbi:hypothetical protein Megpolyxen_01871 (plasmid) [Candidatus Megaera polyxenophila]|jgi:hypothetical protein|nr:hypothetical protein Megpolyxen_01871 [Candidatus Megaera polyxenophila]